MPHVTLCLASLYVIEPLLHLVKLLGESAAWVVPLETPVHSDAVHDQVLTRFVHSNHLYLLGSSTVCDLIFLMYSCGMQPFILM